jgi:hypothetical protein
MRREERRMNVLIVLNTTYFTQPRSVIVSNKPVTRSSRGHAQPTQSFGVMFACSSDDLRHSPTKQSDTESLIELIAASYGTTETILERSVERTQSIIGGEHHTVCVLLLICSTLMIFSLFVQCLRSMIDPIPQLCT